MSGAGPFLRAVQEEHGGSIPFWRFMQEALYHPEFGYYRARVKTVGREGDFSTWPTMNSLPARAIAAWLKSGSARHIIEIGAGTGVLAAGVLRALGFFRRWHVTYHIVEISRPLRARQRQRLGRWGVRWHGSVAEALAACRGEADIFSNELVDAFPCRVFVRDGDTWKELALHVEASRAREVLRKTTELPESSSFALPHRDGARVEVHESFRRWLGEWIPLWKSGRLLTIDYGGSARDIQARHPRGSLRAYARQHRLTGGDVYGGFGTRDITADVNFTDLTTWGEALGLETLRDLPLGTFLTMMVPSETIPVKFLPAAEAFRVLEQRVDRKSPTGA